MTPTDEQIQAAIEALEGWVEYTKEWPHLGSDTRAGIVLENDIETILAALRAYRPGAGSVDVEGAVNAIIDDLSDRRDLKNVWFNIDEDVKNEIKAHWESHIKAHQSGHSQPRDKRYEEAYVNFPHAKIDEAALEYRERVLDWFEDHYSVIEDALSLLSPRPGQADNGGE